MRWVLDIIAVLTAAGLVTAVIMFNRAKTRDETQIQQTSTDLRRIELELKYRSVTKNAELNEFGWPSTVSPEWFDKDLPRNTLVSPKRPWLEVAGESEAKLMHPPVRLAVDDSIASYWYNPFQGVVRARVPVMLSDQEAVNLYNRVNGTSLGTIFEREWANRPKPDGLEPVVGVLAEDLMDRRPANAGAATRSEAGPAQPAGAPRAAPGPSAPRQASGQGEQP